MQDDAVKPMPEWMHEIVNAKETVPEPSEKLDDAILAFSQSDVWKYLKDYMNSKRGALAIELRKKADDAGNLEEIGFRFLSLDLLNKFVDQLIARVDGVAKIRSLENEPTAKQ